VDAATGKCLAYCASGTRSTFAWAMGQAREAALDDIAAAAARGGYDLTPIMPLLERLGAAQS